MFDRQQTILSAVVQEYTKTAMPVGSDIISEEYIDLSPATVRAEMNELEKTGYLYQPHASAGRIPTDKGFRFFVNEVMEDRPLSKKEIKELNLELLKAKTQLSRLSRTTAKLLSNFTKTFSVAGFLNEGDCCEAGIKEFFNNPEFTEMDQVVQAAEILDYLDEWMDKIMLQNPENPVQIYIGKENPISKLQDYSMIVSKYSLPDGRQGYIAVVGPKGMQYDRNISFIEHITKLLTG